MKKLLSILGAALLIISLVGHAAASFEDLRLIRTIYDSSSGQTTEVASDLGAYALTTPGAYGTNVNVGDLVSRSSFAGATGSLKIAYSAFNDADVATADYWVMSNVDTGLSILGRRGGTLQTYSSNTQGYYAGFGGTTVTGSQGAAGSYFQNFERNGTAIGSFANSLPNGSLNATVDLSALEGPDHHVDSYLYYFDYNNSASTTVGVLVATIRTYMTAGTDGDFNTLDDNMIGTIINPATLTAPGAPTIGTATAGNQQATVTFTAPASDGGSPILSYTATSTPGNITGTCSGASCASITVTGLTNNQAYTFTVHATNAVGPGPESAASNSVTPTGGTTAPGAPTIGTATAGNAQATVTFTAPTSDGGSTILSYTATSTPGNITGTCSGASCASITVTGLANGTAYTFKVKATNAIGTGPESAVSNSVTPTAPTITISPSQGTLGTAIIITGPAGSFSDKKGKVLINGSNVVKIDKDGWADNRIAGTIKKVLLPVGAYDVTITSKGMASDIPLADGFTFMDPELDPLTVDHGKFGDDPIIMTGNFFGIKKPKVYLEDPTTGKKKNCKVIDYFMNTTTGESDVTFVVPKGIVPSILPYSLKLDNKIRIVETFFTIDF